MSAIIEGRNNQTLPKLNWQLGFNINKKVGNRLYLKSGLRLASMGYKSKKYSGLSFEFGEESNGAWNEDTTQYLSIQGFYDYWFAEIPLQCRYELGSKRLNAFLEGGFSTSIFLTSRLTSIVDGTKTVRYNRNFGSSTPYLLHLVANISFGVNYSVNERYQVFGQPIFRYHITSLKDSNIKEHLFSGGVEMGVRRRL